MDCSEKSSNCRVLLIAVLASLLLMCGGLGLFFFHQASVLKIQVYQAERVITDYDVNGVARVNMLVSGLQNLAKNNPELNAILTKYALQPGAPQPAPIAPPSRR